MQPVKALLIMAAACLAGVAQAGAAGTVPKPTPRPAVSSAEAVVPGAAPIPRARPAEAGVPAAAVPVPQQRPAVAKPNEAGKAEDGEQASQTSGADGWPADAIAAERAQCKEMLAGLDIRYAVIDAIGQQGGCGAPAPIEVSAVAGVRLVPPATQTCAMAAALAAWVTQDVQPAAQRRLGTAVTEIRTATSYACRRRNNGSSGKMSEHSKANALDMSGFTFAKTADVTVSAKANWGDGLLGAIGLSKDGSFLEDIRKGACTHFTTVLGPGSDPFHGDHFHVDVLQRKGGYRICQ